MNKNIVAVLIELLLIGGVYSYTHQEVSAPNIGDETQEILSGFKGLIVAADFAEKIESGEYIVLDVRTAEEYDEQRIGDDALLVDFYAADFKQQLDALDKSKKYLMYCRSGGRSSAATEVMKGLGFEEFYELKGGINSWNRADLLTYSGE